MHTAQERAKGVFPCIILGVLFAWATGLSASDSAAADDWKSASVSIDSLQKIDGLVISSKNLPVKFRKKDGRPVPVVIVEGAYNKADWALFYKKTWLVKTAASQRSFRFPVELGGAVTIVKLGGVGPTGKMQNGSLTIQYPGWERFVERRDRKSKSKADSKSAQKSAASVPAERRVTYFTASLSGSSIAYQEAGVPDFNMLALTPKFALQFPLVKPNLDLVLNTFFTAIPLSASRSDVTVRFLGINGRVGYRLPFVKSPWSLSILGGWYYTTMIVTNSLFGFKNLSGPQLFPLISRQISAKGSIYGYAKFAPIVAISFSPSNRELAFGTGYVTFLGNGRPISFNLDYSSFQFTISTINVNSTSVSLGMTYGLF